MGADDGRDVCLVIHSDLVAQDKNSDKMVSKEEFLDLYSQESADVRGSTRPFVSLPSLLTSSIRFVGGSC